jgi:hypothetical protein
VHARLESQVALPVRAVGGTYMWMRA